MTADFAYRDVCPCKPVSGLLTRMPDFLYLKYP